MKSTGILFSAPMVRAIRDGRKTQTRRVVNPQPNSVHELNGKMEPYWNVGGFRLAQDAANPLRCPYVGLLWVREAWATEKVFDCRKPSQINKQARIHYMADGPKPDWAGRTRRSIFMPRWASRIARALSAVRVERLQDISEEDAIAEGMHHFAPLGKVWGYDPKGTPGPMVGGSAKEAYAFLWDSINSKKAPWASNPWVWVIEFKRKCS